MSDEERPPPELPAPERPALPGRRRAVSYGTLCAFAALLLMLWLLCSPQA